MGSLERTYSVRDGFDGETQEEALSKAEGHRGRVDSWKEEFRPVFEEELDSEVPRHPFKVMMDKRRDLGLYRHFQYSLENSIKIKALQELKEEFTEEWQRLASQG